MILPTMRSLYALNVT